MDWVVTLLQDYWNQTQTFFKTILNNTFNFFKDLFLDIVSGLLDAVASVFTAIPAPDFLNVGLSSVFSSLDPGIVYFLGQSGLFEGLTIFGSGVAFRLMRKLFTLGQW